MWSMIMTLSRNLTIDNVPRTDPAFSHGSNEAFFPQTLVIRGAVNVEPLLLHPLLVQKTLCIPKGFSDAIS